MRNKGDFYKTVICTSISNFLVNSVHTFEIGNRYEIYKSTSSLGYEPAYDFYYDSVWVMGVTFDFGIDDYFTDIKTIRDEKIENLL